jgi:hypothetical protein
MPSLLADGDDPFRFLTFGGTFWRTFGIFLDHADIFLILSCLVVIPVIVIIGTLWIFVISVVVREIEAETARSNGHGHGGGHRYAVQDQDSSVYSSSDDDFNINNNNNNNNNYNSNNDDGSYMGFYPHHIPMLATIVGLQLLTYAIVTILGRGAMCRAVAELYIGKSPDWKDCLMQVYKTRKGPLLGASVTVTLALGVPALLPVGLLTLAIVKESFGLVLMGTLLLLGHGLMAFYAYASTVLVTPALVIEPLPILGSNTIGGGRGGGGGCLGVCFAALQRSWDLSAGSRCYILCSLFSMFFVHELIRRLLHNMFASGDILDFSFIGILMMMIPMILFLPLYAMYVYIPFYCCEDESYTNTHTHTHSL